MSEQKRGIKGRVYLSDEQVLAAGHQFGCGRFVYNRLLEFSQERYFTDKTKTSPKDRSLELTRLKTELPWLREVNAQSLQQTGRALDSAYKNWIDSITGKRPDQVKPPKFKKKSQRQSARFTRGLSRSVTACSTFPKSEIFTSRGTGESKVPPRH